MFRKPGIRLGFRHNCQDLHGCFGHIVEHPDIVTDAKAVLGMGVASQPLDAALAHFCGLMAQMLFDANAYDKARTEYERILTEKPDDPDALANMGLLLFNLGAAKEQDGKKDEAKAMYQLAANYLGQFVEKAPDGHKFKSDAKAVLAELKNQQNVQAEKPAATPSRRKRP